MRNISSSRVLVVVLLALLLSAIPLTAACSKPPPAQSPVPATKASPTQPAEAPKPAAPPKPVPPPPPTEQLQKYVRFGAGTGGESKIFATALSELLNKYVKMEASVTSGSGMVHYPLMNKGEVDVLPYELSMPLRAYRGMDVEKTRLRDLTAAGGVRGMLSIGLFTLPNAGIKSFKEIRGKKVHAENARVPRYAAIMDALLKLHGMTRSDIVWMVGQGSAEQFRDLKEKRVDVIFASTGTDTLEAAQTTGIYAIPFSPEEQAAAVKVEEVFVPWVEPKGIRGLQADAPLIGTPYHFVARAGLNDVTAYTIVKTLYDHLGEFHQANSACTAFTLDMALSHNLIPVHPGAIQYYREKGIWAARHEAKQQELLAAEKKLYGN